MRRPDRAAPVLVPVLVFVLSAVGAGARAAGLRDLQDGWLLTPETLSALLAAGPDGAAAAGWRVRCGVGAGRLYGLPELPLKSLDLRLARGGAQEHWSLRATWQETGVSLYRARRWRLACARRGTWRLGLRVVRETTVLAGAPGPGRREHGLLIGRRWRGSGWRAVVDVFVPLEDPPPASARAPRPVLRVRWFGARAALALAVDRRGGGPLLAGGEFALGAGPAALLVRCDGGSASLGPGLAVRTAGFLLRTSHVLHPVLGTSHRVEIVWGARGP